MIVTPGPVVDFLIANQNVKDPFSLDWVKVSKFSDKSALCCVIGFCFQQYHFYLIILNRPRER